MMPVLPATPRSGPEVLFDGARRARIEAARAAATSALLAARNVTGGWTGELSASALSTATAVTALTLYSGAGAPAPESVRELIQRGYEWLIVHQNPDGGWGDTIKSASNISTTTLVWAALGLQPPDARGGAARSIAAAERWLTGAAGSLEPEPLVRAIEDRYGRDRTFSVPILTMCALCGRLGPDGWRYVRQLPFELAALPQRWFAALQLPVVSYALPALIAIGHVRHGLRPTRNPVLRLIRNRCRPRTLDKLARLQPGNGGFLEATPLTSFVTMSLAALGLGAHPVVQRGVTFILASVRADGSWPIDTNLSTWVTTLAVNALLPGSAGAPPASNWLLAPSERVAIRDWLTAQQGQTEHPYTLAAPGGWAWTDLPGGVPDADDTAGALLALHRLGDGRADTRAAAERGVGWLLNLQNRDGGIPTFCRGWGKLPFDRSSPDLTAHAIRAWLAWRRELPATRERPIERALVAAANFLRHNQRDDGAWVPLWFGHQRDPRDENALYGTARVVPALCEIQGAAVADVEAVLRCAVQWLVARQDSDGGWSGAASADSSVEETALALEALACAWECGATGEGGRAAMRDGLVRGAAWLADAVERETWREAAPIGLYFAKLWYYERLYPLIFATGALKRLAQLR